MKNKQLSEILLSVPILLVLSTVFAAGQNLGNGVVSGKYFWFYGSMALFAAIAVPVSIVRKARMKFALPDLLLFLFCAVAVGVTYCNTGRFPTKSLLLVFLSGFWFCLRIFLAGGGKLTSRLLLGFFMLTGLAEAVWGLWQLYGVTHSQHYMFSLTGSFFNPGPYSGWLATVFPVAVGCAVQCFTGQSAQSSRFGFRRINGKSIRSLFPFLQSVLPFWLKAAVGVLTVTATLLVLPAGMSRASWLAASGGAAFVAAAYYARNKNFGDYFRRHGKRIILLSAAALIVLSAAATGLFLLKADSASGRILTWKITVKAIARHPAGVGLGNFSGSYGDVQAAYFASGAGTEREEYVAGAVEYAFNEYLQTCMETGIAGFLIFMTFAVHTVFTGIRRRRYLSTGAFISLLIFAAMSYPLNILPFVIAFVFLAALVHSERTDAEQDAEHAKYTICGRVLPVAFCVIFSAFCFLVSPHIYKTYGAYRAWHKTQRYNQAHMYGEAVAEYEKQYPYLRNDVEFLLGYEQSLSKTGRYEESNRIIETAMQISCEPVFYNNMGKNYQALKEYELAERCFKKAANTVPNRLYPHYLLAKLYYETGQKDRAEAETDIVLTKPPKVESTAVKEMREELIALKIKADETPMTK